MTVLKFLHTNKVKSFPGKEIDCDHNLVRLRVDWSGICFDKGYSIIRLCHSAHLSGIDWVFNTLLKDNKKLWLQFEYACLFIVVWSSKHATWCYVATE